MCTTNSVLNYVQAGTKLRSSHFEVGTLAADPEACARQQYVDPKGWGLGSVYIKGLYREYTDASFTTRKQPNPQHGILGPILHAHVGDTLVIVFTVRHRCAAVAVHRLVSGRRTCVIALCACAYCF